MSLIVNLQPSQDGAENGAEKHGLAKNQFGQQGMRIVRLPKSAPYGDIGKKMAATAIALNQQQRQYHKANDGQFEIFPQFLPDDGFHGFASVSDKMNDFSPRSPR